MGQKLQNCPHLQMMLSKYLLRLKVMGNWKCCLGPSVIAVCSYQM